MRSTACRLTCTEPVAHTTVNTVNNVAAECGFDGLDCVLESRFSPIEGTLSLIVHERADTLLANRSLLNAFVLHLSRTLWLVLRVRVDANGELLVRDASARYRMPNASASRVRRAVDQLYVLLSSSLFRESSVTPLVST